MRESRRGAGKLLAMVLLLVLGGASLLYVAYRAAGAQHRRATTRDQVEQGEKKHAMTEEERLAYIEKNVVVNELTLAQDTKPDSDEPVPGLFRVTGIVVNNGDEKLDKVILNLYPEDANGNVIGSYVQNVAGPKGLQPKGSYEFKFTVPEKKEYGGKFRHTLR